MNSSRPSATAVRKALLKAIETVYKSEDLEKLTLSRLRTAAEDELQLEHGYFKKDAHWEAETKR